MVVLSRDPVRDATNAESPLAIIELLVLLALALFSVAERITLWSGPAGGADASEVVFVQPADLALLCLLGVVTVLVVRERRTLRQLFSSPLAAVSTLTMAWFTIAFLFHPSWRGLEWLVRVAATAALVWVVARAGNGRRTAYISGVLALSTVQASLAIAQSITGGAVGLRLFEWGDRMYEVGDVTAARGSLPHPYYLAGLLLMGIVAAVVLHERMSRGRWSQIAIPTAIALNALVLPFTFSRAAQLALVPIIVLVLWRSRTRGLLLPLLGGLAAGTLLTLSGQSAKLDQSLDSQRFDSGRLELLAEATELTRSNPVLGVGPGRYVLELRAKGHGPFMPPHNIVAHAGAEAGLAGGGLMVAMLATFALWAARSGTLVLLAAVPLLPFLLLDWYPYASPPGMLMSALWFGTVIVAAGTRGRPSVPSEAPSQLHLSGDAPRR